MEGFSNSKRAAPAKKLLFFSIFYDEILGFCKKNVTPKYKVVTDSEFLELLVHNF